MNKKSEIDISNYSLHTWMGLPTKKIVKKFIVATYHYYGHKSNKNKRVRSLDIEVLDNIIALTYTV